MKFLPLALLIVLTAATDYSQDQKPAQSQAAAIETEVKQELNQTARDYKTGDYLAAEQHAQHAVLLDPSNKTAAIFLARVRHQRFRPGVESAQNLEIARSAIDAYQQVLNLDPQNEEAYKAVAVLYAATHQNQLLRAWVLQRALNPEVPNQKRADAYAILAGKDWDCSYRFTELPNHKVTDEKANTGVVFKMGDDVSDFQRARQCVTSGLEMADAALLLDYDNESAWAYKTVLLLEAAKLAEMEGLDLARANYRQAAKEAGDRAAKISEDRRRKEEQGLSEPQGLEFGARPLPPPPVPRKPRLQ